MKRMNKRKFSMKLLTKFQLLTMMIFTVGVFGCGDVSEYSNPVAANNIDGFNWLSLPLHEHQTPDGISFQKVYFTVSKK